MSLRAPVNKQKIDTYSSHGVDFAACGIQGWRTSMEDKHLMSSLKSIGEHHIFAVFDGHAGWKCSKVVSDMFVETLENSKTWKEYIRVQYLSDDVVDLHYEVERSLELLKQAIVDTCIDLDEHMKKHKDMRSGSTGIIFLTTPCHYICANIGDSRCVLHMNGLVEMSTDHKPYDPAEEERIIRAGHFVQNKRVDGDLAVSRAFGDFIFKTVVDGEQSGLLPYLQAVSVIPEIRVATRDSPEDFVILACDGLWDVMSSQYAVDAVKNYLYQNMTVSEIVSKLIDEALKLGSTDNISVMVGKMSL